MKIERHQRLIQKLKQVEEDIKTDFYFVYKSVKVTILGTKRKNKEQDKEFLEDIVKEFIDKLHKNGHDLKKILLIENRMYFPKYKPQQKWYYRKKKGMRYPFIRL